jgi:hypothetical protein
MKSVRLCITVMEFVPWTQATVVRAQGVTFEWRGQWSNHINFQ